MRERGQHADCGQCGQTSRQATGADRNSGTELSVAHRGRRAELTGHDRDVRQSARGGGEASGRAGAAGRSILGSRDGGAEVGAGTGLGMVREREWAA